MTSRAQVCTNHSSSNGVLVGSVSLLYLLLCLLPSLSLHGASKGAVRHLFRLFKVKIVQFSYSLLVFVFLKLYRKLVISSAKMLHRGEKLHLNLNIDFPH